MSEKRQRERRRVSRRAILAGATALVASPALARPSGGIGTGAVLPHITDILLSGNTAPSGTVNAVFGALSLVGLGDLTGTTFDFNPAGTDNSHCLISSATLPSNLTTNGAQGAATYTNVEVRATKAGAIGSPFTKTFSVTITAAPGRQITTATFTNDTGGTLTAGNYLLFGALEFKDNDLAGTDAPQLLLSGVTAQDFSYGPLTKYDSGFIRIVPVVVRPTFDLAAGASQDVQVWSGGTWPADALSVTDVRNAIVQINVTGAGSNYGLTGNWCAQLGNPSGVNTTANRVEEVQWFRGACGVCYKVTANFVPADASFVPTSATPDPQMLGTGFIWALADASHALGCIAFEGQIRQPKYNDTTQAKVPRVFSTVSWQEGATPNVTPLIWPFAASNFTTVSTAGNPTFATTAPNNYYQGPSNGGTNIPVLLSGSGTMPTDSVTGQPLDRTKVWWLRTNGSSTTQFQLWKSSNCNTTQLTISNAGSGTLTVTPLPASHYFSRLLINSAQADPYVFKGLGSIASPALARMKFDFSYFMSTDTVMNYDQTIFGSVADVSWSYTWTPVSIGTEFQYLGATGDSPGIGPMSADHVRHIFNQSATSALLCKTLGLANGMWGFDFRDKTTLQLVNIADNAGVSSYTGLPSGTPTVFWVGWTGAGFTLPTNGSNVWPWSQNDFSHIPEIGWLPYLITGRPCFLEFLVEKGLGAILSQNTARNTTTPLVKNASCYALQLQTRTMAWGDRDLQLANRATRGMTYPGGVTGLPQYIDDMGATSHATLAAWLTNAPASGGLPAFAQTNGMLAAYKQTTPSTMIRGFQSTFILVGACLRYQLRGDVNSRTVIDAFITWWNHRLSTDGNVYHIPVYYEHNAAGLQIGGNPGGDTIADDAHWGIQIHGSSYSIASGNPAVLTITVASGFGHVPADGDRYIWTSLATGGGYPGTLTSETPYYGVNTVHVSGNTYTCNLASSPGGTPLNATNNGTLAWSSDTLYQRLASPAANTFPSDAGATSPIGYGMNVYGMSQQAKHLGRTGMDTVATDVKAVLNANGVVPANDPRWALSA